MNFKDVISAAVATGATAFHEYLLELSSPGPIFHAFFEGKSDLAFYGTFIRTILPEKARLRTYRCGNKSAVLFTYTQVTQRPKLHHVPAFFVDKDLDDLIPVVRTLDGSVFVTDFYSIENYVVNQGMLDRVLGELFHCESGSSPSIHALGCFDVAISEFHTFVRPIMAWVILQRRAGQEPQLANVNISRLFSVSEDLVFTTALSEQATIQAVEAANPNCPSEPLNAVQAVALELSPLDPKRYVRGHFEMQFFVAFLRVIASAIRRKGGPRISVDINEGSALALMGPRTGAPHSLMAFLADRMSLL